MFKELLDGRMENPVDFANPQERSIAEFLKNLDLAWIERHRPEDAPRVREILEGLDDSQPYSLLAAGEATMYRQLEQSLRLAELSQAQSTPIKALNDLQGLSDLLKAVLNPFQQKWQKWLIEPSSSGLTSSAAGAPLKVFQQANRFVASMVRGSDKDKTGQGLTSIALRELAQDVSTLQHTVNETLRALSASQDLLRQASQNSPETLKTIEQCQVDGAENAHDLLLTLAALHTYEQGLTDQQRKASSAPEAANRHEIEETLPLLQGRETDLITAIFGHCQQAAVARSLKKVAVETAQDLARLSTVVPMHLSTSLTQQCITMQTTLQLLTAQTSRRIVANVSQQTKAMFTNTLQTAAQAQASQTDLLRSLRESADEIVRAWRTYEEGQPLRTQQRQEALTALQQQIDLLCEIALPSSDARSGGLPPSGSKPGPNGKPEP